LRDFRILNSCVFFFKNILVIWFLFLKYKKVLKCLKITKFKMNYTKEKTLKCLINPCKFNRLCQGCSGVQTPHYPSDSRCEFSVKNWQSPPKNYKAFLEKISVKEKSLDEIIQICPEHFEFYQKASEMQEKFNDEETFLEAVQVFNEIYRKFYECRDFFKDYFTKIISFLQESHKINENDLDLLEKIAVSLKILAFAIMKNMKMKETLRKNEDLLESLFLLLKNTEFHIKTNPKIKGILSKTLFLLTNLNNLTVLPSNLLENLFDFCLRNLDNEDFELYFHLISCIWGLSYDENIKKTLKKMKESYFFRFFNENKEKFDIQFRELMLGFLFFVYGEEIKDWKAGNAKDVDIDKFMVYMEKNAMFSSYRINCLFE